MSHRLARLSVLFFLAGCSILEPRADPTRFFVLSPAVPPDGAAVAEPALVVAVGPVRLPDYLLRPELVRRAGPNQLEPSRVDRWAEPLDRALLRVLCLDLAALLPHSSIVPFPVAPSDKPALQVELELTAFEGDRAGHVRLEGRMYLRDLAHGSRVAREFRLERAAANGETPELVATLSSMLSELAAVIAHEVGAGSPR